MSSNMGSFIDYASNILAETDSGISTSQVIEICNKFAVEYNVAIPYTKLYTSPFTNSFSNKRSALKINLSKFSDEQAFNIIKYICELPSRKDDKSFNEVKIRLYKNFSQFVDKSLNQELNIEILEVKGLLDYFPSAKSVYDAAVSLYKIGVYERNIIDSLRLTIELVIKQLLNNDKSLEKNINEICSYIRSKGCSKEFVNMFQKLLDYYTKYNNDNVKHNNSINSSEIDFVFGLTNLFINMIAK